MMNNLKKLDGRHKLAVVGALVCWGLSMYFSKEGFSVGNTVMLWVGWVLAGIVTVVELVFNSPTQKLSLTLIVVGILCYVYGIWTNVTGFWELQHPQVEFVIFSTQSLLSWFVGFIMEVLPEPLFMWGIASAFDGDFLGNLAGLWSGNLPYAQPGQTQPSPQQTIQQPVYRPQQQMPMGFHPNKPHQQGKVKPNKIVSNIFNPNYTDKFKK